MKKKKHWYDYLWIWAIIYFALGFFNILFAWFGMIDFLLPLGIAIFGGNKFFCNHLCGRGQLFSKLGGDLKCSRNKPTPQWMSSKWFRYGFLIFFLTMFGNMVFQTYLVGAGASSLREAIKLFWTFRVPWGWTYTAGTVADWVAQFSFGFYSLMLTSLLLGLIVMDAGKEELLKNNEKNTTNKVIVSTYFSGELGGKRVVINDSPGVNYSGDKSHEAITDNLIKSREYDLIIYIMNATQLATNDEDRHLEYVKKMKGNTPILFVMNKVDSFSVEEENIKSILERQREYLKRKGFKNPIVCPVSARAGYLAKLFDKEQLSKSEKRELYNYVDKFEQVNLPYYYRKYFKNIRVQNTKQEEKQLIKTCGLAYVEKIISRLTKGGQVNGTGLC